MECRNYKDSICATSDMTINNIENCKNKIALVKNAFEYHKKTGNKEQEKFFKESLDYLSKKLNELTKKRA